MATPKAARKNAKRNLKKAAKPVPNVGGGPGAPPPPKVKKS